MGAIADNISKIKENLPEGVTLVAVSKTKPPEDIQEAYNGGQRVFGENKIQELVYKQECLPGDILWHMIGHLQTNKVKYIAGFISLIHSVDSIKLLKTINKEADKHNRVIDCLLQVKIAKEITKFGLHEKEVFDLLGSDEYKELKNVRVVGLMGMATYTDNETQIRTEFSSLQKIFQRVKAEYFQNNDYFSEISMGMSKDYLVAVNEGSTLIRVGSGIFGQRVYT